MEGLILYLSIANRRCDYGSWFIEGYNGKLVQTREDLDQIFLYQISWKFEERNRTIERFFFSPFLSGLLPKLEFQRVQVLGGDLTRGSLHFDVASIYNYIYGEAHRSANMEGEDNLFSLAVMIMSYCP